MRSILAAVGIALLTTVMALQATPSSAQLRDEQKAKRDEDEAAIRARERKSYESQYKSTIDRLPNQKYDPWRNLR